MKNKKYDVSVIVPIYNVEEYLEPCLESLHNQTMKKLEVIMVDDGSLDNSFEIAKAYADKYDNFFLYQKENGGLGMARNYGIERAHGKYIVFIDSDDVVDPDTYQLMFNMAEKNKSELTICNVVRLKGEELIISDLHREIFNPQIKEVTHISKDPVLVNDTASWNKLILRSFWDKHNFSFPEGVLYEDIPVAIPLHYLANHVSVLKKVCYYWRIRDGISKSITQNSNDIQNFKDRMFVLGLVNDFFDKSNFNVKQRYPMNKRILERDLILFINQIPKMSFDNARIVIKDIKDYIESKMDLNIFNDISFTLRQMYSYIREENLDKILELIEYRKKDYYNSPIIEKKGKFIIKVPDDLFESSEYDVTEEMKLTDFKNILSNFEFDKNVVTITGNVFIPRVNIKSFKEQKIKAFLISENGNYKKELTVINNTIPDFSSKYGVKYDVSTDITSKYNYDGTGYKIIIDLDKIKLDNLKEELYDIVLECSNRVTTRTIYLNDSGKRINEYIKYKNLIIDDNILKFIYSSKNNILLNIRKNNIFVKSITNENNKIFIEFKNEIKNCYLKYEDEIIKLKYYNGNIYYINADKLNELNTYELYASNELIKDVLVSSPVKKNQILFNNDRSVYVTINKNLNVYIRVGDSETRLYERAKLGSLVKFITSTVSSENKIKNAYLYYVNQYTGKQDKFAKAYKIETIDNKVRCSFLFSLRKNKNLDYYEGYRHIKIMYQLENGEEESHFIYKIKPFKYIFKYKYVDIELYRGDKGTIRMHFIQKWSCLANKELKRKKIKNKIYPILRKLPLHKKTIVFSSMWGSKYSCNPRHLYEYIDKYYPDYKCVWFFKDGQIPINGHAKKVRNGSFKYYYYLAVSKYFVNNVNYGIEYIKRKGQIELHTMHGTPLKTLGLDVKEDFPNEKVRDEFISKINRWDYLITQGKFIEDKAYQIYLFDRKILKTGYPRTDILFNVSKSKIDEIKKDLNLPLDKKIILYAPTWRVKNKYQVELDIEKLKESLSDEYIIISRIHHLCSKSYDLYVDYEFSFDLTKYHTIEDLYLISDLLITDYSSVMFDYALLDKPMLFYTYDLEDYRDNLRGMYIDFENEAPGPLIFDTESVISEIKDIKNYNKKYENNIKNFKSKFLTYENGESSKKVVDEFIKPKFSMKREILKKFR